jgi:hypothetical protein
LAEKKGSLVVHGELAEPLRIVYCEVVPNIHVTLFQILPFEYHLLTASSHLRSIRICVHMNIRNFKCILQCLQNKVSILSFFGLGFGHVS